MKPWLRRIGKALVVLFVLVLLLPLIVFTALQNDQVRSLAVDRALTDINTEIPGTVELTRVEGSLFGQARLHDLRITDARGNLAAHVEVANLEFRILPLVTRSIVVDEVRADTVTAVARTYQDGILNWDLVIEPDPEPVVDPFDWPIYLDVLQITDGAVAYLDETTEIEAPPPGLDEWRRARTDELDEATGALQIRSDWSEGFGPEVVADLAEPRAPTALWLTDLEVGGEFRMRENDIHTEFDELVADLQTDILPDAAATSVADIDIAIGVSTLDALIGELEVDGWLSGGDVRMRMIQPGLQRRLDAWDAGNPLEEPFEQLFVDLGWQTVHPTALQWAVPDVTTTAAIHLSGDLALDQQLLAADLQVNTDPATQPLQIAGFINDYDADAPGYELVFRAEDFAYQQWLVEPETVPVETSVHAHLVGQGFDPQTLRADLRLRLDDTLIDETVESELLYAAINVEDGVIEGYNLGALTPYLDLVASFRFDPEGQAVARVRTSADADQTRRTAEFSDLRPDRAEFDLDFDARFEPDFEDFEDLAAHLTSLDASASWEFANFDVDPLRIDDSSGATSLDVERTATSPAGFAGHYEVDADLRGFQLGDYQINLLDVSDRGYARVQTGTDEPMEAIEDFENNARLQLRHLRSPDADIDTADITASVGSASGPERRADVDLDATVGGLRSDELSAGRLHTALDGDLRFGNGPVAVEQLRARGSAQVADLITDELSVDTLDTTFDADIEFGSGPMPIDQIIADLDVESGGVVADDLVVDSIDAQFDGSIQLADAELPLELLAGELDAEIGGLATDDISVDTADANFSGRLDFPGATGHAEPAPARITVNTSQFDGGDFSTSSLNVGFDGQLQWTDTDILLSSLDGILTADARQLSADDVATESANLRFDGLLELGDGESPLERMDAAIAAELSRIVTPDVSVADLDTDFDAVIDFGQGPDPLDLVQHFEIDGDASTTRMLVEEFDAATEGIDLSIDLAGPTDDPGGDVRLQAGDIRYGTEEIEQASAALTIVDELRRGRLTLDVQRRDDEQLQFASSFDFEPDYQAFELSELQLGTERTEWTSAPDAVLRWTGTRAEADNFSLASAEQSIFVDGHLQPDVDQNLEAAVDLQFQKLIDDLYLDRLIADLPALAGHLQMDLTLDGTAPSPIADLRAQLDGFHIDSTGPFSGSVGAAYGEERLRVRHLQASAFNEDVLDAVASLPVAFDMSGDVEFFTDRHSELEVDFEPQRLRRFHRAMPVLNDYGVDGVLALEFDGSGTMERPFVDLDLDLRNFRVQGELDDDFIDLRNVDLASQLIYEPTAADGDGLDFSTLINWDDKPAADIALSTPFPFEEWLVALAEGREDFVVWRNEFLDMPFELHARLPSMDLERIPLQQLRDENLTGELDFDFTLAGTIEDPDGYVDIDLREAGWSHFRDFSFELDAQIDDQRTTFDRIHLNWAEDDVFTGQGVIPLPLSPMLAGEPVRDLPIDFQWRFHDMELSRLSAIDYSFARVDGFFGAAIDLDGSLRSPEFSVEAGVFETRLGDRSQGSLQLEIDGVDDRVSIDGVLARDDEPFLSFDGQAPIFLDLIELADGADWQADGPLHFHLDSERIALQEVIPTHLLTDYIVDPRGLLMVEADIDGTWEQLGATGFLDFRDGALTLPDIGRGFEDINGRVDLDDDEIRIDHVELHDGPSSLHLNGLVEHDQFVPGEIDFEVEADQFNLVGFGVDFPLFLSADASARGQVIGDPGEVDVRISGLEVVLTDEWDRTLHATDLDPDIIILDGDRVSPGAELIDEAPGEFEGLNLRVNIIVERDAWARHPAGNVNFQADLGADITGDIVAVTGNMDILRGRMEFLGRRFDLQQSEVTFTGSIPPNPRLRMEAHHPLDRAITQALGPPTTGEPRIIFNISGTAEQPRLELRSDPAMTDTEILFVLMTGRPPDRTDIGREEGVANQALAAVSGVFFGLLQDELAGSVPVDVFRVEPGVAGARGGRLEVGSYLTNDLFFAYRRQFGADEDVASNVFRLEYHFMPRWMVELLYTDRNEGELNLFWDVF